MHETLTQETYTSDESLRLRRLFPARRERVFRAWTHPEALKQWWSPPGLATPEAEIDLRPGGQYRIGMRPVGGGATFYLRGQFVTIDQPKKLVYTWNWESEPADHETLVTVEFVARGESTEVIPDPRAVPLGGCRGATRAGLERLPRWHGGLPGDRDGPIINSLSRPKYTSSYSLRHSRRTH